VPTYQYACTECGEQLEAVQSFSDPALTECPACGGKLRKVFSSVGVVFKGSGFYRNDSRSGAATADKSNAPATGEAAPKTDKPAAASAESSSSSSTSTTPSTSSSSGTKAAAATP
jgi:putative FmdB family regulatory protein